MDAIVRPTEIKLAESNRNTVKEFKVYLIRDKAKNIVYVGLTRQTLSKRFIQHCSRRQWNKNDFSIELVEENLTQEQAIILEELLIIQYRTRETGLNVSPKAINGYSNAHSEEQKAIWSKERKGKPVSPDHAAKNRTARLGAKNGETWRQAQFESHAKEVMCLNDGIIYPSARAAAKAYDANYTKISMVCNGKRPHTKGYKFKFVKR